ncbi:hypothetical protein [Serratia fonticola]|uniref:hypothetical protein n=1 Tax=Serratia fonticola TaxID=47917 RepID=UPI0034C6A295
MNETNHPSSLATCTLIQDLLEVKDGGIYEAVVKQKQQLDAANCILSEFKKVGDLMLAQDNRCTDQPMFVVFEKVEVVSHEDYDHDRICWIYDSVDCGERTSKRLEALHQGGRDCGEYQRVAVKDTDRFVTACFTEQGCKDYLAVNGHNLRRPFIYAAGSFRNSEYQSIRNAFMAIAKNPNVTEALAEVEAKAIEKFAARQKEKSNAVALNGATHLEACHEFAALQARAFAVELREGRA